jgi:addiction module HigA family antidote
MSTLPYIVPEKRSLIHPGDILRDDFMKPRGISAYAVAKAIGTTQSAISEILRHKRAVSVKMSIKLAKLFKTTPQFWTDLQTAYDLEAAKDQSAIKILAQPIPLSAVPPPLPVAPPRLNDRERLALDIMESATAKE